MTVFYKILGDLAKGIEHLLTWKVIAAFTLFVLMAVLTCGGSLVGTCLLYAWGDTGVYSGRAKNTVYTKKGVRRGFTSPSNPQSDLQTQVRNLFKGFSSMWRSLTSSQLAAWRNLVMEKTNRLGQKISIKGKEVFVMINTNLGLIGVAPIHAPATLVGQAAPVIDTVSIDVSDAKITFTTTNAAASAGFVLYASLPVAPGRSKARMASIYFGDDSTAYVAADAWTAYIAHYGYTPQAGDVISLGLQYINNTTGENGGRTLSNRTTVVA